MSANAQALNNKKHPPGLYLLFLTEMWERFSYYGMRAILILYLTTELVSGGLGIDSSVALSIYGFYTGAVYFTPLVGGWLADRYLGHRLSITIGGTLMALGNIALFAHQSRLALFIGLLLMIIGNGFFKPNISTLLGDLYKGNESRRDAGFTIFYMGINLGAFFAPLLIGFLSEDLFASTVNGVMHYGFRYGFLASAIGMIIGQVIFNLLANKYLGDIGKRPATIEVADGKEIKNNKPLTRGEKQRTWVIIIITCFVVFFWAGFEQAGSSLTLYTKDFVDREVFGWTMPISWFQSLNPFFIVLLAPAISALWVKLANSKRGDIPVPTKMAMGMITLGLGYIVLLFAVFQTGNDAATMAQKANMMFIIVTYLMHTLGELFLSPVGLSLVSRIAPVKLASLLMGVWLASSGIANILAGQLAAFTQSLGYFEVFAVIGGLAIFFGLLLLALSKKLVAMMETE
ncbi:MFS transporter [Bacillus sp. FJAT-27916]|uniref:peptide MFS transporter n=1 Tax=Bacillus sp. FJAT-27916 TaxID=1679169 RepID=UPI0006715933|nr:peptide MFS transporter [Bacillus sp. FJAT-27916]KMY45580.1 MFS transporter [Bacillus sp. FJAT-27916]